MFGYFQYRAQALCDDLEVGGFAEVAGVDAGCAERIAGTQGESTPAARTRTCHQHGEVRQRRTEAPMVHECGRPTSQLNIGDVIAVGGEKTPDIATEGAKGATTTLLPAGHVFRGGQLQQICRVFRRPDDGGHGLVVEVGSDAWPGDLERAG